MSEKTGLLGWVGERPMRGRSAAVCVTATPSPPGDAECIPRVVGRWWVRAQQIAHLASQLQGVKLCVTRWVRDKGTLCVDGAAGAAGAPPPVVAVNAEMVEATVEDRVDRVVWEALALVGEALGSTVTEVGIGSQEDAMWNAPCWRSLRSSSLNEGSSGAAAASAPPPPTCSACRYS
jgi:hypothetical protein